MSTTEVPSTLPGNVSLADHDPEMFDLIEKEKVCGIEKHTDKNASCGWRWDASC